ncbi:MAG: potassium-transporting ATPase subunit F [Syntrophobacteraceae bacterium]|nr:potassium-transporting ATPase subunit F [Syntrophobacteraceae bacterium]
MEDIVLLLIVVALIIYLSAVLARPDKF